MRRSLTWTIALTGAVGIAGGIGWLYRTPLVTGYVDRNLAARGVEASYRIDQIGFRTQKLSNVVIGDPSNPDLIAREMTVEIELGFYGPKVARVEASGVRLRGRWTGERMTFGQLDRLKPVDDGSAFELPDMAVAVRDVGVRLETPWGVAGLGVAGNGHLRDGFTGLVAVRAPLMEQGGCIAERLSGELAVAVDDRVPSVRGPIGLGRLNCSSARMGLSDVKLGLRASAREDMTVWQAQAGIRTGAMTAQGLRSTSITGSLNAGSDKAGRMSAQWSLSGANAAGPWLEAQSLMFSGEGALASDGAMVSTGNFGIKAGRAGRLALRQIAGLEQQGDSTPIGPLLAKAGLAISQAGRQFEVDGQYELSRDATGVLRASLGDLAARANSGAALTLDGERAIGWDSKTGLSLATIARVGGGGLPEGEVRLTRSGGLSPLTGLARFEPYQAGSAVLAMAPLRFSAAADGSARFATGVALSGPLAGGQVDRLSLPIAGRIAPDGEVSVSGECRQLAWRGLDTGGVRLNGAAVRLCGQGGRPLLVIGPGGVRGGASLPAFALSGWAGTSPFSLMSDGGSVALDGGGFDLRNVDVRIGSGESLTRFAAARLDGAVGAAGLAGTVAGVEARIGAVPFLLSDGSGLWRFAGSRLSVDAGLRVTDAASDARFRPLRAEGVRLLFSDGVIETAGWLHEEDSGTPVAELTIRHMLANGHGEARFAVPSLRFARDGLQPRDLSPLALGVIADAQGVVTGSGQLAWDSEGIRSSGDFATERLDFAAAFGPVERLSGRLRFDDLLTLSTPPHQEVLIGSVNPGIEVNDGRLLYQLRPGQKVRIEGGRWPFAGGELRLQPAWLDFGAEVPRQLTFDVASVDAALFLQRFEFENISATGVFDGVLPTVFDQNGGRVDGGMLVSRSGGSLAYVGELSIRDLGAYGNLAFGALKSIRYDSLSVRLNGAIDGEMLTQVDFTGLSQGEGAMRNFLTRAVESLPFTFSIRITAPFRQLLSSAQGLYDPTTLIEQNLPALVEADRAARAAAARSNGDTPAAPTSPPQYPGEARPAVVQPRESEDRP
ncbi:YdbH domain-containing protein [Sphingomonas lacunae]|uniref:YdbH domain-containing protein n=1 Tax=Sphingomonas lacunae TaxID=2698828 RepID=A0A6M4B0I2_9SPHN|nr:YdbH domain-containing protein [Sphingomonas lacunae]QJQ32851.1 YdbH domain-containing protein [Sphingomonas lacunae]